MRKIFTLTAAPQTGQESPSANTGAPRASLAARLRELEEAGLVERRRYSSRPPRDEYLLTPAGRDLSPVLRELRVWGERHAHRENWGNSQAGPPEKRAEG